jgi:hypothetical protein
MQKNLKNYFWDGDSNISEEFKLQRIIEYASFPDLISYPFVDLKTYLPLIKINRLRTSEKRKQFIELILPYLSESQS